MLQRISISDLAKYHGTENLRFRAPLRPVRRCGPLAYTTTNDDSVVVECLADENTRYNRKLVEGYKILLRPADENLRNLYGYEEFYQMDFESLCERFPEQFSVRVVFDGDTH